MARRVGVRLQHALARHGGFSETTEGVTPKSGIMVSMEGSEEVKPGLASPNQIESYRTRRLASLKGRGRYFGGWVDDGSTYLDVSTRFPVRTGREAADIEAAKHAATANRQISSYNVDSGGFPPTEPSLFPLEPNVDPKRVVYRHRSQVFGESARRARAAQDRGTQLELPFD